MKRKKTMRKIKINFNGETKFIDKKTTYNNTIQEIQSVFSLPEIYTNSIKIHYTDSDDDVVYIDEENFNQQDTEKSREWYVEVIEQNFEKIQEKSNLQISKKIIEESNSLINQQINDYQNNLISANEKVANKILEEYKQKKINELQEIEKKYDEDIKKYQEFVENNTKENLSQINEQVSKLLMEMIEVYEQNVKNEMNKEIDIGMEKIGKLLKDMTNLQEINNLQNNMMKMLAESKSSFNAILEAGKEFKEN